MPSRPSEKNEVPLQVRHAPAEVVSYSRGALALFSRGSWALIAVAIFSAALAWASGNAIWGWVSFGLLSFGLAPEILPAKIVLNAQGVTRQIGFWKQQFSWLEVADYEVCPTGVWLVVAPSERNGQTFFLPYGTPIPPHNPRQEMLQLLEYYLVAWRKEDSTAVRTARSERGKRSESRSAASPS